MIGYHYTTREAWEQIQCFGLCPAPLHPGDRVRASRQVTDHLQEYDEFLINPPILPYEAIWVFKKELNERQVFVVSTSIAALHNSHNIVALEVKYPLTSSASLHCPYAPQDLVKLTDRFLIGRLGTGDLPIDLIVDPVPANDVMKLWGVDLMAPFRFDTKDRPEFEELV